MKFSEHWLREMVNLDLDRTALLNQMTMAGLEVTEVKPVAEVFCGVLIGKIITYRQHLTVSTLCVAKIDIGKNYLNIVCSDLNFHQGMKVVVATLGAELPNRFKIKPIYIHGELSEGILCSFAELGISNDYYKGIIKLPVDAPVGTDIRNYLQLDDYSIEISVTSNRADCLSVVGIARDVAALNNVSLNTPIIKSVKSTITDIISICVDVTTACPRYLGRIIKGVNIKAETPLWMIEKLRRCGISSINPIIDITNYVLLELGQPMHAFDLDHINGGIIIRMANDGEVVTLLNNNKAKLNSNTLVVSDNDKILAIGGILGSLHASINENTQNIFFECAFFNPSAIIGRANFYGLHTNSSYRYERGVDQELQHKAIERATYLLINICGGKAGPIIDKTNKNTLPQCGKLTLHREKLNRLLGHIIKNEVVSNILICIGCKVTIGIGEWRVIVPSWRFDLTIEEDLIEEIARIYGYNNIPNIPIKASLIMTEHRETNLSLKRVKSLLVDKGYQEVITYSFVDPVIQQLLHPNEEALTLPNPISKNMSVMRLSLWTGLLSTVIYNYKRQQECVRLFEAGLCFVPDKQADLGVHQNFMLSGILSGNRYQEHWDLKYQPIDFYDLKGDLESLLDLTGKLESISFRAANHPAMHPGKSATIYLYEECVGFIGVVHPKLELKLNLNKHTIMFELIWSKIADRILPKAYDISRFPANRRDIAMIVNENVPAADIIAECKKVGQNQVVSVKLFDVYRGKGIKKGKKSLAISLIVQDTNRTLEEEEIAATINKCVAALKERFQATLRD